MFVDLLPFTKSSCHVLRWFYFRVGARAVAMPYKYQTSCLLGIYLAPRMENTHTACFLVQRDRDRGSRWDMRLEWKYQVVKRGAGIGRARRLGQCNWGFGPLQSCGPGRQKREFRRWNRGIRRRNRSERSLDGTLGSFKGIIKVFQLKPIDLSLFDIRCRGIFLLQWYTPNHR